MTSTQNRQNHKEMKRYLLLITLMILGITTVFAQEKNGEDRKRMHKEFMEFKMNYLAKEMELRDDQKQQFFSLYEEMSAKRRDCMREAFRLERKVKKQKDATESDYQAVTDAFKKARAEDMAIEDEYAAKFSKILSSKQMYKMKEAEDSFRQKMERMRHNNKQGKRK